MTNHYTKVLPPRAPRLPAPGPVYSPQMLDHLSSVLRIYFNNVDEVLYRLLSQYNIPAAAAPTTGEWAQGDFVRNEAPAEAGSPGSKYVVHGWQCVVAGSPGTWVECRFLTGN